MKKYAWIAAAVLAADQLTKAAARTMTGSTPLIPGVIGLQYCQNTGMAFSLFSGHPWLLGLLSLAAVAGGWLILRRFRLGPWSRVAAMLMLGGALGNAVDRLLIGAVTDMFQILLFRFAVFNVADAALTVGCGTMAATLIFCNEDWREKGEKADA